MEAYRHSVEADYYFLGEIGEQVVVVVEMVVGVDWDTVGIGSLGKVAWDRCSGFEQLQCFVAKSRIGPSCIGVTKTTIAL